MSVCAPADEVWTCVPSPYPAERYAQSGGTSCAAPHVAGLATLLLAKSPGLYNDDVRHLIELSAEDLGPLGHDPEFGHGRIDVGRALQALEPPYSLMHQSEAGYAATENLGGTNISVLGVPPNGCCWGDRYRVVKAVTFGTEYLEPPNVWGRSVPMEDRGWSADEVQYAGLGWCGPVAGSITTAGCQLETYVYYITGCGGFGGPPGWYPCHPDEVEFAWTVHGIPTAGTGVEGPPAGTVSHSATLRLSGRNPSGRGFQFGIWTPVSSEVRLAVYDLQGRHVRDILVGVVEPGETTVNWNGLDHAGRSVSSGVYFARLESPDGEDRKKLVVLR